MQSNQNDVAWLHRQTPYLPENPPVFSRLQTFNSHPRFPTMYPSRGKWYRNKRRGEPIGSGPAFDNRSSVVRWFHYPKRRFTVGGGHLSAPLAPRNTTSFIIRAKKSGGIASPVSPYAVTPTILTTPELSSSTEVIVEMAKEKWGVDGYGTMKGLIRLRSKQENSGITGENNNDDHMEVERRLINDLSKFEMIYPSSGEEHSLENRVDGQDLKIACIEEQNLLLKERIYLLESELNDLRRRVISLETEGLGVGGRDSKNGDDSDGE